MTRTTEQKLATQPSLGEVWREQEIVIYARAAARAGMNIPAPALIGSDEREDQFELFKDYLRTSYEGRHRADRF